MQKVQKVAVRSFDGQEKELVLLRVVGKTAYVCSDAMLKQLSLDPAADVEVGVPVSDVRLLN